MRVVVTKKPFKGHAVGSEIDITKRDARALMALGRVAPVVAVVVAVAEVVADAEPEPEAKPQKRSYQRRDMTAKD